jgi:prevent-host-death family protein
VPLVTLGAAAPRCRHYACYCVHMAEVGIRELKQRLSEYLDRAERGEVVQVTHRGRPKAILGPVPGRARVEEGIRAGWITPGTGSPLKPTQRAKASRRVLDVLSGDRDG